MFKNNRPLFFFYNLDYSDRKCSNGPKLSLLMTISMPSAY